MSQSKTLPAGLETIDATRADWSRAITQASARFSSGVVSETEDLAGKFLNEASLIKHSSLMERMEKAVGGNPAYMAGLQPWLDKVVGLEHAGAQVQRVMHEAVQEAHVTELASPFVSNVRSVMHKSGGGRTGP